MPFNKRVIDKSKTLGERLRKVRQEQGVSLEEVAKDIQIRKEYLQSIEEGNYRFLPGPVYIENFLRKYARYLKVSEDFVMDVFKQQDKKVLKKQYQGGVKLPSRKIPKPIITPKIIKIILIVFIISACLTYVGFEITEIFSPPELVVLEPDNNLSTTQNSITVSGTTDPEAQLTINGKQTYLDEKGEFIEVINLNEGVNKIIIKSVKKRSKEVTEIRHVLY
ncbi:helix-turn-helix domain-containing protein, partial [Patescibacteria group bacterium]|nr:helix-turn-helix domain-containing protein [Patescibacteria group bacterium]